MPTDRQPRRLSILQSVLRAFSLLLLLASVLLIGIVFLMPISISGILYIVSINLAAVGLVGSVWGLRRLRWMLLVGITGLVLVAAGRVLLVKPDGRIRLLLLPAQDSRCWLNCLIDEGDAALLSTHLLPLIGWISPTEQQGLPEVMAAQYQEMTNTQSPLPSPFLRTYLNQQRPAAFDTVIIEPEQPAHSGVIFLHGFTGNFTLSCWLFARAVQPLHMVTVCPSVGWKGDWWTADGEATLRATLDYLWESGVTRIYLAGLSNGAVGASELAYKLADPIAGLVLVSGASPDARDSGLPILVISGTQDERMPIDMLRAYATRMGSNAAFIALDADHFMLAKQNDRVLVAIESWLRQHILS
jgi:pimeloyl-ACP methyl ester carboxylesterase